MEYVQSNVPRSPWKSQPGSNGLVSGPRPWGRIPALAGLGEKAAPNLTGEDKGIDRDWAELEEFERQVEAANA